MSFNTSPGRAEYTAGAGQTIFPFSFKIFATTDLKVYQTPAGQDANDVNDLLTLTTDYTVTINGDLGGNITLVTPSTVNDGITLVRDLPIERPTEYQDNGDLLGSTLNQDQDYQTYLIADKDAANSRFVNIPESAQGVSTTLPNPAPLNFIQWNPTGTGFQNVSSLQADGFIWTAADVYNKTEANALLDLKADQATTYTKTEIDTAVADRRKLYAVETTTHNFTSDADYTLTTAQNLYGRIVLTDTTVALTVARNVVTDDIEKSFIVQNDTLQTITIKTLAGSGVAIPSGKISSLYNDGVNIIESIPTSITSDISFSGGFDLGQIYQVFTVGVDRSAGVTYTNTTGKPIIVSVRASSTTTSSELALLVDGINIFSSGQGVTSRAESVIGVIPNGSSYVVNTINATISVWAELR